MGPSLWGRKESDTSEHIHIHTYIQKFHSPNSAISAELGGRQMGFLSLSRCPRTQEERQSLVMTGNGTSSSAHARIDTPCISDKPEAWLSGTEDTGITVPCTEDA